MEILKTKQVSELRDFMISDLVTLVSGLLVVVVDLVWTTGGRGYLQQAWLSLIAQLNLSHVSAVKSDRQSRVFWR